MSVLSAASYFDSSERTRRAQHRIFGFNPINRIFYTKIIPVPARFTIRTLIVRFLLERNVKSYCCAGEKCEIVLRNVPRSRVVAFSVEHTFKDCCTYFKIAIV